MNQLQKLSRRRLLKVGAGALLTASLWPGALRAAGGEGYDFSFFFINDLHYTDKNCGPFFEALIAQLKASKSKCDFCILGGDLSENGKPDQLAEIRDIFKTLDLPIKVVIGNHDWLTDNNRKSYEELYPDSLNYTFEHKGWQFVAIDSSRGRGANVAATPATINYIQETLPKLDKKRPMMLFTHLPLGERVVYRLKNADVILENFKEYNLQAICNGHFHGYTQRDFAAAIVTTNQCCSFRRTNHDGTKEKSYFTCHVKDGKLTREHIEFKYAGAPAAPATKPD